MEAPSKLPITVTVGPPPAMLTMTTSFAVTVVQQGGAIITDRGHWLSEMTQNVKKRQKPPKIHQNQEISAFLANFLLKNGQNHGKRQFSYTAGCVNINSSGIFRVSASIRS
eukprot:NODE_971_length_709_cov_62.827273_g757_i0.p1 GENE.NODE_971_length_709_cov_62.827273_g757_i0~~NODE_971_length_709_cov_62.827273_g757_i0.p1  ORF type:complete len:111 (-),score=1.39 NODE_971_length_709_cov_62.827273_g757_i0:166-498(-)